MAAMETLVLMGASVIDGTGAEPGPRILAARRPVCMTGALGDVRLVLARGAVVAAP